MKGWIFCLKSKCKLFHASYFTNALKSHCILLFHFRNFIYVFKIHLTLVTNNLTSRDSLMWCRDVAWNFVGKEVVWLLKGGGVWIFFHTFLIFGMGLNFYSIQISISRGGFLPGWPHISAGFQFCSYPKISLIFQKFRINKSNWSRQCF